MTKIVQAGILCVATALTACGGGGGGGSNSAGGGSTTGGGGAETAGGVYSGSVVISGVTYSLRGVINENGVLRFAEFTPQGAAFAVVVPSSQIPVGSFSASGNVFAVPGQLLDNGAAQEAVTVAGTVAPRSSISGTSTNAANNTGTFTVAYSASQYERPASLDTVAGGYTFTDNIGGQSTAASITINSHGSIAGNNAFGCVYTGSVTVPNPAFNAYDVTIGENCVAGNYIGIGTYTPSPDNGATPPHLQVFAANGANGFYAELVR